ncbi:MAG: AAA family ATPase [Acidobacteriota bacterium]
MLHLKYSRIQFTPDLMPGDIVGSAMMETEGRVEEPALPTRPHLRQPRSRRRNQSRDAQDAVRIA